MTSKPILVVDDPCFDAHVASGPHPECPERLSAAREGLEIGLGETPRTDLAVTRVTPEEVERVHPGGYRERLLSRLAEGVGHLDADTFFSAGSQKAALSAAGAAACVARALAAGTADRAVALVRPPGHHATPSRAMGFCLLNNIAIAAAAALDAGVDRIAIVDFDVHHGNGTQAIFESDPRVLFVSTHEHPQYPGTGRPTETGFGAGAGYTANVALPTGTGPAGYADAYRRVVLPMLDAYEPELTFVSAGYDGHHRDPIGGHEADASTYGALVSALIARAPERGIGLFLEGGYDLRGLQESVRETAGALCGQHTALPEDAAPTRVRQAVDATRRALSPKWVALGIN